MKVSEIELSKNYLKRVFDQEKDQSVKNYIVSLQNKFKNLDLEDSTFFKIKLDDLLYTFKKSNNLISVFSYSDNKSFDKKVETIKISHKDKINFQKEEEHISPTQEKNISITINCYSELVDAMKCVLWSLKNNPSTIKKIFQHIYIKKDDEEILIPEYDYEITNKIISQAYKDNKFYVQKLSKNGKLVWLYNNTSNKRIGWFIDGKIRSVEWLSKYYEIPRTTLQSRLKKMNICQAIQKEV
jgi:hypothetical protein